MANDPVIEHLEKYLDRAEREFTTTDMSREAVMYRAFGRQALTDRIEVCKSRQAHSPTDQTQQQTTPLLDAPTQAPIRGRLKR
jgi:hypothetical protein